MKSITKKRTKAFLIDLAIAIAVTYGVEYFLRKKVKNQVVHSVVTPTIVMWTLEYAQLRRCGQTIGYKRMGQSLENKEDSELTPCQIIKRMSYRNTVSIIDYLKSPRTFEDKAGALLPHDRFSDTKVKEL